MSVETYVEYCVFVRALGCIALLYPRGIITHVTMYLSVWPSRSGHGCHVAQTGKSWILISRSQMLL
jgi:hypothetical protein